MLRTPEQLAYHRAWQRDFNHRNKDRINAERRERHANDPEFRERMLESNRRSVAKRGPEAVKAEQAAKYQKHKHKYVVWAKRDRAENPGKYKARAAAAKAKRKNRAVAWADKDALSFFYECCPAGCEVDHIVPLCGEKISGLHVPENLQWLPALENNRKSNNWNST